MYGVQFKSNLKKMKDFLLYVHTHKPLYSHNCDWKKMASTNGVENSIKIHNGIDGVRLDEFDSFVAITKEDSKYLGVCHYRRRPLFFEQERHIHAKIFLEPNEKNLSFLCSKEQKDSAIKILESHDVIQYRPYMLPMNYREQFGFFTPVEAFDIMVDVLSQLGMGDSRGFYLNSNAHVWATLMIASKEIFCKYVDFIKNIARLLCERGDFKPFLEKNDRLIPLLLERLTPFWIFHNRLKSAFVPAVILEKNA